MPTTITFYQIDKLSHFHSQFEDVLNDMVRFLRVMLSLSQFGMVGNWRLRVCNIMSILFILTRLILIERSASVGNRTLVLIKCKIIDELINNLNCINFKNYKLQQFDKLKCTMFIKSHKLGRFVI